MMAKSPYDVFETDESLEREGIIVDYGDFYFKVARAGGANTKFREHVRAKLAPYQRAIELGEMSEELAQRLTGESFAETVVITWGVTVNGKRKDGAIPGRDGKPVAFSVEACKQLFRDLPAQLDDLMSQSTKLANFRKVNAKDDAGNSRAS
jgi:hypothetical protein